MKIEKINEKNLQHALALEEELALFEAKIDKLKKVDTKRKKEIKEMFKKKIKDKKAFGVLAKYGNEYIAFLTGWIEFKRIWRMNIGYLCDLYVKPKYRKLGIGKMLVNEFIRWLKKKKIKYLELDVYYNNLLARKAWSAIGFKPYNLRMIKRLR